MTSKPILLIAFFVLVGSTYALDQTPIQEVICTVNSEYLDKEHCFNSDCSINISKITTSEFYKDKSFLNYGLLRYTIENSTISTKYTYGLSGSGFDFFPSDEFIEIVDKICIEDSILLYEFSKTIPNNTDFKVDLRSNQSGMAGINLKEIIFTNFNTIIFIGIILIIIVTIIIIYKTKKKVN